MLRSLFMTGLMVEALQKVYENVGVLLLPDVGVHQAGEALMDLKTASWRTSNTNSRSELVMVPPGLVKLTSCLTMSAGHFTCQAKLMPSPFFSIHTPGALSQVITVSYVRCGLVDKLNKIGRAGCYLDT